MAETPRHEDSEQEVRQKIAHSRDHLGRDLAGLRYELDFPLKLKKSFQRKTVVWVTAAVAVGLVVVMLPARKKRIYVDAKGRQTKKEKAFLQAGLGLSALKLAMTFLQPMIMNFVMEKVKGGPPTRPGPRR